MKNTKNDTRRGATAHRVPGPPMRATRIQKRNSSSPPPRKSGRGR